MMCWQLFYHGQWTPLAEIGNGCHGACLWPKWEGVFELQGWLNGACNNESEMKCIK